MAQTVNLGLQYLSSAQAGKETVVNSNSDLLDALPSKSVATGAFASRPAAGWNGRLYYSSDGFSVQRDSGSAWQRWGPLLPLTDPTIPAFAFTNQGTASLSTTTGSVVLTAPSTANDQLRILDIAAPTAPYTITIAMLPMLIFTNFMACGLCLRDSAGGGVVTFHLITNTVSSGTGQILAASKWTSPTAFSADYTLVGTPVRAPAWSIGPCMWLQMADDNTNRMFRVSNDGVNFTQLFSVVRTDFITPNRVGIFVNPNGAGAVAVPGAMNLISWRAS